VVDVDFAGGRATIKLVPRLDLTAMLLYLVCAPHLQGLHFVCAVCSQVVDVDFAGGRATIKLVPRLDLTAMAKDHMGGGEPACFQRYLHCCTAAAVAAALLVCTGHSAVHVMVHRLDLTAMAKDHMGGGEPAAQPWLLPVCFALLLLLY
jgi:hypothetical protein